MKNIRILAIDIDGILTRQKEMSKDEVPNLKNIITVNRLYEDNIIVLYTSRDIVFKTQTEKWLTEQGVRYHDIVFNKIKYDVIVDDRAMRLEDL